MSLLHFLLAAIQVCFVPVVHGCQAVESVLLPGGGGVVVVVVMVMMMMIV